MEAWTLVVLLLILGSIVVSEWRKVYFTLVVCIVCTIVFAIQLVVLEQGSHPEDWLSFHPHDLLDPGSVYTILTSMYAHANLGHVLINVLGLALIGLVFEQRIGTRPFILLYFLSGLIGTLAFAVYYWNSSTLSVIGASGAISGVLGGFARLYPNERMSFIFFPGIPMRAPYVVLLFVAIQLVFITGPNFNVAWQSHLGGLAAGILLAPLVVRFRAESPATAKASPLALRKLAATPELRGILGRIESESVPDVRKAWVAHFMSKARCPICGSPVKISGDAVRCSKGHVL